MRPFSTLPVRGQLEPYTPDSRPGWRYLQCTDTPNELKVLLPPRTATLYARILELEQDELAFLARDPNHSWERIMQIRHLKDRLERKCHRMARFTVPQFGAQSPFRVVNAPADFRLKELERWLREHDSHHRLTRDVLKGRMAADGSIMPSTRSRGSVTSASPDTQSSVISLRTPRSGASKRLSIASSSQASTAPTVPEKTPKYVPSFLSPVVEENTVGTPTPVQTNMNLPDFFIPGGVPPTVTADSSAPHYVSSPRMPVPDIPPPPRSPQHPLASAQMPLFDPFSAAHNTLGVPEATTRAHVVSPDPLPHPYTESSGYVQPPGTLDDLSLMDEPHDRARHPPDMGMPHPAMEMPIPETVPPPAPESVFTESEVGSTAPSGRPGLARRRSSLKNNRFSLGGAAKVVSWAMDNDWAEHMGTYERIAYGAEMAGEDLNKARVQFEDELVGVRNMRDNIALSLERLRLETEQLKLEERALKDHEESMTSSFKKLRDREAVYKDKVTALIEETRRVVLAADGKRDHHAGL
ncbi:hypothetical protein PENSPDRAFT_645820 [Peniophora sp. CONT]|nr:hypothetical protein PENSPDRAFT_645820 [Peniophora sp. CONT]